VRTTSGASDGSSAAAEFREANVLPDITAVSGTTPSRDGDSRDGRRWQLAFPHGLLGQDGGGRGARTRQISELSRVSYAISGTTRRLHVLRRGRRQSAGVRSAIATYAELQTAIETGPAGRATPRSRPHSRLITPASCASIGAAPARHGGSRDRDGRSGYAAKPPRLPPCATFSSTPARRRRRASAWSRRS
jgi:hypothetical protein